MQHRTPRIAASAALLLSACLLASGCKTVRQVAARYPRPDLDEIYEGSRKVDRNPVILVPGFGGSTIVHRTDGKRVWGSVYTKDTLGYKKPEGMQALAIDIGRIDEPLDYKTVVGAGDDSFAEGLLESMRARAVVTHVNFRVYASLIELLEGAGYVAGGSETPAETEPGTPRYYTFVYDWRRDNVANAIALGEFVERARLEVAGLRRQAGQGDDPVRFDLIAHSMGGLVARYFFRYGARDVLDDPNPEPDWAGTAHIDRAIFVSPPNLGAMKVLRNLIHGHKPPFIPRFESAMTATFLSAYQMLPRERHPLFIDENGDAVRVPFMSVELWRENGWGPFAKGQEKFLEWVLPELETTEARTERFAEWMEAAFDRGKRFNAALDVQPEVPAPIEYVLFAGDAEETLERGQVRRTDGRLELIFEGKKLHLDGPGDGTISRASALGDERLAGDRNGRLVTSIPWEFTIFVSDRHSTFLGNPTFQNNLLHILVDRPAYDGS